MFLFFNSRVFAGAHNLYLFEGTEQTLDVVQMIMHEDYNGFTIVNDICILQLGGSLVFDESVVRKLFEK